MKTYKQIVKQKGLEEREHQKDFLTNGEFQSSRKPFVLAAGTSAGKTPMATMHLEMFYSNPANKNKTTLFISASKTILRDNVHGFFKTFKPSFSYSIVKDKKTLESALERKAQVLVLIPQTIKNYYKSLPQIHTFILDEAQEWYFAKVKGNKQSMLDKILNHIQPTKQLLLTGTPSKFVADGNKFNFQFVPVMDLYDQGLVSNVKLEVVSSTYDFKASDWQGTYGNLKSTKTNSPKQAEDALYEVCKEMIDKLKNPLKEWYNVNNITKHSFGKLFKFMDKTIIYTHSKNQADKFHKILNDKRELKGKVLLSHSENDPDSIEFNKFKTEEKYHILIAVDRGRIGFDMPNLKYIIDFTMTQNLDMLLQMYGRVLRLSKNVKNKTYFKVATKNTADYFVDLMTAMLCLTTMEWYSKYNGKNMGGIHIPKVLTKSIRNKQYQQTQKKNKSNKVKPYVSLTELGIPMDLNFFRQSILHTSNGKFNTIAETTLDDVRREFFDITYSNRVGLNYWNEKNVAAEAKKYNTITEFQKGSNGAYCAAHKLDILDKVTAHMVKFYNYEIPLEELIKEAKKYNTRKEFQKNNSKYANYCRKHNLLDEVCSHMNTKFTKWNKKNIIEVAKKCKTLNEFNKKYLSASTAAKRLGIFENVTKHMKRGFIIKSDKELMQIAKRYKTQREWYKDDRNSFVVAKKRECFNKCVSHMPKPVLYNKK